MAAKFVVAVALFAVCSSSPVLINGVLYRDGRAYSFGQATNYNGGPSVASANVHGENAQAYGSTAGNQLSRDGLVYPGQAIAQAQTGQEYYGGAKAVAQAHNGYYPVPVPATVITYGQNFEVPAEVPYETPGTHAHSTAISNGVSDSTITHTSSNGGGLAQSSANTDATSSNSKTYGYGHADSNANSGLDTAISSARTQGQGSASSTAHKHGIVGVVYPAAPVPVVVPSQELQPAIIAAKTPVYHTAYVPVAPAGIASSNANAIGNGHATSSAKITHGRTISWRFGTLYDSPAANSANAAATTYSHGGSAKSHANTNGYGLANADATSAGHGVAKSSANTNGYGAANAGADVAQVGQGHAKSSAHTNGAAGSADSSVYGGGAANSLANTGYGSAQTYANTGAFGQAKSDANVGGYDGSRTSANAQSSGYGNASSVARTQPVSTAYRVANSQALGAGYALANARTA